jgi:glycosyltransferase involved in cell wall biosynthesis
MRVAYLTNNPATNSTARILQSFCTLGPAAGIEPILIAQHEGPLAQWARNRGIPCLVDAMCWPGKANAFRHFAHLLRVRRFCGRHGVDLVHCNEHNVHPFGQALGRALGVPVVCHVRFRLEAEFAQWAFRGRRAPQALLWTSRAQQDDWADSVAGLIPAERQHLVPLGLDTDTFGGNRAGGVAMRQSLNIADDAVVIATASALRPIKRIHEFVELVARLATTRPNLVGLIAGKAMPGDEAYHAKLLDQIAATGLGSRLRCVGHLDDVEPLMHAADVFISASEYETFGNSVLEAMACATPVAGYTGGSVAEVVGDTGLIAPTGNFDELLRHAARLVDDAELRRQLGSAARQRVVGQFSPAASFARVQEIYRPLVARRAAA